MASAVKFEVVKKSMNGRSIFFQTSDPTFIPSDEQIQSMALAGYTSYLNGKVYNPGAKAARKRTG